MSGSVEPDSDDVWQDRGFAAVQAFAVELRGLHQSNPWPHIPALPQAMAYLMTELWDRGFTQTQIREGFETALIELPKYTLGDEIRP
ncbi:MAG: hypothetical protein B7Y31_13325 [Novosphingobium sp. 16-62-11]|jgi:hypothetical protein|uniref:hypothetical protein n=1 Tax=Novosphingobium sp. 17-62-19 TaxID=1970406 RepID=UPI000BC67792|nr:hypothetical protein [Novosphingobium sp. 17-62-19]OYZ27427.1 MAG: hypothetical protein B7Y31_13325 [Novosphingobium sp. 16-62-11]OZA18558.1 MAG: hypothetical protein B7X90_11935 [Novosphingobium sp. 17-62-19]HQS97603.1 hypothetical protein [Novosphingobium sp.]